VPRRWKPLAELDGGPPQIFYRFLEDASFIQSKPEVVIGKSIIRSVLNSRSIRTYRSFEIAHLVEHAAEIPMSLRHRRIGSQSLIQRLFGGVQVAHFIKRSPEKVVRFRKLVLMPGDYRFAGFDNSAQVAVVVKRAGQIQVGIGEDRLLLNCPSQFND